MIKRFVIKFITGFISGLDGLYNLLKFIFGTKFSHLQWQINDLRRLSIPVILSMNSGKIYGPLDLIIVKKKFLMGWDWESGKIVHLLEEDIREVSFHDNNNDIVRIVRTDYDKGK
jgi:hypothetical protein